MGMEISALSEKLKRYHPKIYMNRPELSTIQAAELYEESRPLLEPEVLYLSEAGSLPDLQWKTGKDCFYCLMTKESEPEIDLQHTDVNIMILKCSAGLNEICKEIQIILEEYFEYTENASSLQKLIFHNEGIQQILDAGLEIFKNPLILEDSQGKIIASSSYKDESLNSKFGDFLNKEYSLNPHKILEFKKLFSTVVIQNSIIAKLSVVEYDRAFRDYDSELLLLLARIIGCEMEKDRFKRYSKGLIYESMILDLIEGNVIDPVMIKEKIRRCEWHIKEYLYILTIDSDSDDQTAAVSAGEIRDALQEMVCGSKSVIYNNSVILIITRNYEQPFSDKEYSTLKHFLSNNRLYGGLSRSFKMVEEINKHYRQSVKAMELGLRLHKEETIFLYEGYVVFHMLDVCSKRAGLRDFCHPSVLSLMEYDRLNHTSYTVSLYAYLKHNGNHKEAVEELHIYPTTLVYRLSKIKNMIQADLNDEVFIFQLLLTFKILEYSGELEIVTEE